MKKILVIGNKEKISTSTYASLNSILHESGIHYIKKDKSFLQKIISYSPDLLFLYIDKITPNSFAVFQKIKFEKNLTSIPIITILNKKPNKETIIKAYQLGCDSILIEPFDEIDLLIQLKNLEQLYSIKKKIDLSSDYYIQRIETLEENEKKLRDAYTQLEKGRTAILNMLSDLRAEIKTRLKYEEDLNRTNKLLQDIMDNSPSLIYILDLEGKFISVNRPLAKLFGKSPEEIIGKRREDFIPIDIALSHLKNDQKVISEEKPITFEEENEEPDGKHYYITVKFPLTNNKNEIYAVAGISTDITESRRAQLAIEESEKRYRDLFDSNPSPMWVYDLESLSFLEVNEAAILKYGYSRDEFLRMTIKDIRPEAEVGRLLEEVSKHRPYYQYSGIWKHKLKNGNLIDVEIVSHVIEFKNRKAVLVLAQDITEKIKAQDELIASETRFKLAQKAAHIGSWEWEINDDKLYWSDEVYRIFEKDSKNFTPSNKAIIDEIIPEDKERVIKEVELSLTQGKPFDTEYRIFSKTENSIKWIHSKGEVFFDNQNKPILAAGTIQDITLRKKTEEALRISEEKYAAFVRQSSEAICLFELGHQPLDINLPIEMQIDLLYENAVITECNKVFAQSHGYNEPSEMYGIKIGQIFPRLAKENVEYLRSFIKTDYNVAGIETKELSKDGSIKYFLNSLIGSIENSKLVRVWGAKQDISKLKKVEDEIRSLNQRLHLLIDAIQNLSTSQNMNDVIRAINFYARQLVNSDCSSFFIQEGDSCFCVDENSIEPIWKGMRIQIESCICNNVYMKNTPVIIEDVSADSRNELDMLRKTFIKSLAIVPVRTEVLNASIGIYWAEKRKISEDDISLIETLANAASSTIENINLLTELENRVKKRTEELELANKELESFSYSVSHDLRAPLRAISGFSNILKEEYHHILDEEGQDYLNTIIKNTKRMGELIDDLLRLSRISKQEMKLQIIKMNDLIKEVLQDLKNYVYYEKAKFTISTLPDVLGDRALLKIAFTNLISNALKFSSLEDQPEIEIGFFDKDGNKTFFIKDNGVGFDMQYINKLFNVFQRLHSAEEFEGTGIGLAIVSKIINRHGGKIWAEGMVNKGATFYFEIPISSLNIP